LENFNRKLNVTLRIT